jgi:archaellum biogenesis ATPase FlaH
MITDKIIFNLANDKKFFNKLSNLVIKYKKTVFNKNREDLFLIDYIFKLYELSENINLNDLKLSIDNNKAIDVNLYNNLKVRLDTIEESNKTIELNFDILLYESVKYIKEELVTNHIYKCADLLDSSKIATSNNSKIDYDKLTLEMQEIATIGVDEEQGFSASDITRFLNFAVDKVPSYLEELDYLTMGGFPKKSLSVLYGGTHTGKSLFCIDIASRMAIKGKKVVYITSELEPDQVLARFDSKLLDLPTWKISPRFMPPQDYYNLKAGVKSFTDNIIIHGYPTDSANASDVRGFVESLIAKGFNPDIIIADSINQFTSIKKDNQNQNHLNLRNTYTEFRALAWILDLPIISPHHLSDEAEKLLREGADVDTSMASDSKSIKMVLDYIVGLKIMFHNEDGILFKDRNKEKEIKEDMNVDFLENDINEVIKLNNLKSRFGSRVGDYKYVGYNKSKCCLKSLTHIFSVDEVEEYRYIYKDGDYPLSNNFCKKYDFSESKETFFSRRKSKLKDYYENKEKEINIEIEEKVVVKDENTNLINRNRNRRF